MWANAHKNLSPHLQHFRAPLADMKAGSIPIHDTLTHSMNENTTFIPLLVVVLLAFLVPFLLSQFKRLNLPIVVGEILAGILIGRSGLALVAQHDPLLDLLSEFGFVFLMFLSGLEIDFSNLGLFSNGKKRSPQDRWGPVQLGSVAFVLTLALSTAIGLLLYTGGLVRNPWLMALILSTTSLGVVVPVLKERGLSSGVYGQTLLIASLIADFATMLLITVEVAIISRGLTLDLLLIGLLFVVFFFMYHFGMWFFNGNPAVRKILDELSSATAQIKVRAAFTMMLIFIVLSEMLGTEIILGAFPGRVQSFPCCANRKISNSFARWRLLGSAFSSRFFS